MSKDYFFSSGTLSGLETLKCPPFQGFDFSMRSVVVLFKPKKRVLITANSYFSLFFSLIQNATKIIFSLQKFSLMTTFTQRIFFSSSFRKRFNKKCREKMLHSEEKSGGCCTLYFAFLVLSEGVLAWKWRESHYVVSNQQR